MNQVSSIRIIPSPLPATSWQQGSCGSIHPPPHPSTPPVIHLSTDPCLHPYIPSLIHPSTHLSLHASTHPCLHSSMPPLIHASTHPLTHASPYLCLHSSMPPLTHASTHPCLYRRWSRLFLPLWGAPGPSGELKATPGQTWAASPPWPEQCCPA